MGSFARSKISRTAVLGIAAVLTAALAACGGQADAGSGQVVVKLVDPGNYGPLAYAKKNNSFDGPLAKLNAKVEWGGTYASFTATTDAIHSGAVNFAEGAFSPALGYLATSDDIKIVAVKDVVTDQRAGAGDGLIVPPDSPIKTVQDLRGKRVAVNKAGRGEYLLLLALEQAGIPADQVQRVHLQQDQAASAFSSGQVDAWVAIVRAFPQAVAKGARVVFRGRDLPSDDLNMFVARTDLLARNPEVVRTLIQVLSELDEREKAEPEKFQNVFADQGPAAATGLQLENNIAIGRYDNVLRLPKPDDEVRLTGVSTVFTENKVLPGNADPKKAFYDWGGAK
ncbi:NrtA/SsuA/CpmA family ABC transporter substrate-binding protein [Actinosynnema sp. NPDC047251]|uniref:Putative aliphatic sulfonates-binding protein n=1 Tax=Saccharothrix espanaensis (strain ATCC 51144 / DSM 44229 / JCM 9112 / NBRC 15066 / NRRL 15764) TaxID=1179773 RepID=K0K497_SACES|nr:NrtA/SsuA/CpmA family ABC transporter substrate-binding protein [Saccharothrix espanaensis]CCH31669.1 ABC-type aliphatic sulfonates transporter,substrate-binding lipoprotein [Saccharothrix espanaensis DSM 44229]